MTEKKWWDLAVPLFSALIAALVVFAIDGVGSPDGVIAAGSAAVFVVAYFLWGRALLATFSRPRAIAFFATMTVSLAVAVAASPFMAIMQTLAYPLAWVTTRSRRGGIAGSVLIGASVFIGFAAPAGFDAGGLLSGLVSGGLSVIFACALGLWITSIAEYGAERAQLLTELTAAQGELATLNHERGVAAERERVSRDIHDTLAQTLAGLVLLSERASRQSREGDVVAATASIATVEQTAREALAEARALVAQTAAVPADDALAAAIERLAERFRREADLVITLEISETIALDREAQVVLLRCLQEALANVRKHAEASTVSVVVGEDEGFVVLHVSDDGVGFDPDAPRSGFGLDGMLDRVALAGGSVEIDAKENKGVVVSVRLPREGFGA
ncbi:sensor histidine kinase [Microbacterium schleiferi]|uniref:histidine kinase n=1 Tax=Microbacterium schleiferi TaxID=69362 RepID=A0A7S8MX02_9MICO|nr:sensor histidine kinase [Microbacterium schleiferi]QPE04075.1 sensor histidine kinase [Microbacterium schleiferi]